MTSPGKANGTRPAGRVPFAHLPLPYLLVVFLCLPLQHKSACASHDRPDRLLLWPGIDDKGAGDLVVKALPPVVDKDPEKAQQKNGRNEVADQANHTVEEPQALSICADNADAHEPLSNGLACQHPGANVVDHRTPRSALAVSRGFIIEKGEIRAALYPAILTGDILSMLKDAVVSGEREQVFRFINPWIKVEHQK